MLGDEEGGGENWFPLSYTAHRDRPGSLPLSLSLSKVSR